MTARILLADDDAVLRDFIALGLREQGYLVTEAATVSDALEQARQGHFDLWVLDRQMPGGDAAGALRELRAEGCATPALILSAARSVEQRIEGFDAGADDYLTKPFAIGELTARVRAILRRPPQRDPDILRQGPVELHLKARRLVVHGHDVETTANEWRLIVFMARQPGVVCERAAIMAQAGIAQDAGEAAVDHMISRLRRKLAAVGAPDLIRTARGAGFTWTDAVG